MIGTTPAEMAQVTAVLDVPAQLPGGDNWFVPVEYSYKGEARYLHLVFSSEIDATNVEVGYWFEI